MKKIIFGILALSVLLTFTACQNACEHSYSEAITEEASCTKVGTKTFTCSQCGDSYTEEIAILDHSFGSATVSKAATCTEEGEKSATCTVCGKTEVTETIPVVPHKYESEITKTPTCIAEGEKVYTCSECSDSYTDVMPIVSHKYTSKVTTAATCTKEGVETFTCSVCNDSYTKKVSAKGHNYTSKVTTKATCAKEGKEKYTCSNCGDSYTESIAAKGHKWVDATCTKAKYCSTCNQKDGKALGHKISGGKCSRCGYDEGSIPFNAAVQALTDYLIPRLKNPQSLQLNSVRYVKKRLCADGDCVFGIDIDYSAMNGFGGYNRKNLYVCVHKNSNGGYSMICDGNYNANGLIALSNYGINLSINDIKRAAGLG